MKTSTNIGLWIDHRKAVIISDAFAAEEIKVVLSNTHKHPSCSDDESPGTAYDARQVEADDVGQRKFTAHLRHFFDEVAACLHEAGTIFIIGPNGAKGEFQKHLIKAMPKAQVSIAPANKMTDRQIAALVRDHFKHESPVIA